MACINLQEIWSEQISIIYSNEWFLLWIDNNDQQLQREVVEQLQSWIMSSWVLPPILFRQLPITHFHLCTFAYDTCPNFSFSVENHLFEEIENEANIQWLQVEKIRMDWEKWAIPIIGGWRSWVWWLGFLSLPGTGRKMENERERERERERKHVTENKNGTCNGYISASPWL